MHRSQLTNRRVGHKQIQRLRLADKGTARGRHINESLLRNLPRSLIARLNPLRDSWNTLNGPLSRNNSLLHSIRPESQAKKLLHQILINHGELPCEYTSSIHIAGKRLKTLRIAENLRCRGCRHRGHKKRVSHTHTRCLTQLCPIETPILLS